MGAFDHLPTLAEQARSFRPNTKPQARVIDKAAAKKADEQALDVWRKAVRRRDRLRCRVCGRKVVVTVELVPHRAECHHVASRADKAVRHDRRNGLLCCYVCHGKLERGQIKVIGTAQQMFTVDGTHYLNADETLSFLEPRW